MIGIVVIGRNEGKRLERCLKSLLPLQKPTVYVDSNSSDGSVAFAKTLGIEVIALGPAENCTSSIGRNHGYQRLFQLAPDTQFIQFVDGDCELNENWLESAANYLQNHAPVAIAAGILEERDADSSIYKIVSKIEWTHSPGEIEFTGGNLMIRRTALQQANGFDPHIIAGEDNEFCHRIRELGWKIVHLDRKMAVHDSKVITFPQFWHRCTRTGYAYAQVAWEQRQQTHHVYQREMLSTFFWGGFFPLAVLVLALFTQGWGLLLLLAYPLLILRITLHFRQRWGVHDAFVYGLACVLGKFPTFLGAAKFYLGW